MTQDDWVEIGDVNSFSNFEGCGAAAAKSVCNATGKKIGHFWIDNHDEFQMHTESGYPPVNKNTQFKGLNEIHRQLEMGNPIMVGVDYHVQTDELNEDTDHTTDHYVVIYQKGHDKDGEYFLFSENVAYNASQGMDAKRKLYLQNDGTLQTIDKEATWTGTDTYIVTQIRPIKN